MKASCSREGSVVPIAIVASYFLGAISSVLAFRFLELFGDTVDLLVSRLRPGRFVAVIRLISQRLHVLSTTTLAQDLALLEQSIPSDDFSGKIASQPENLRWGLWKIYVLERTPALAACSRRMRLSSFGSSSKRIAGWSSRTKRLQR